MDNGIRTIAFLPISIMIFIITIVTIVTIVTI